MRNASWVLHPMCISGPPRVSGSFVSRESLWPTAATRFLPMNSRECQYTICGYRCVQQLLLYHSGCQEVKRAATTYRHNIGAYWTRATFFSALRIWPRYVIIRRVASPRYLWDREWEIEIESCPGSPICRFRIRSVCLSKRIYLRNRNRLSLPWNFSKNFS